VLPEVCDLISYLLQTPSPLNYSSNFRLPIYVHDNTCPILCIRTPNTKHTPANHLYKLCNSELVATIA